MTDNLHIEGHSKLASYEDARDWITGLVPFGIQSWHGANAEADGSVRQPGAPVEIYPCGRHEWQRIDLCLLDKRTVCAAVMMWEHSLLLISRNSLIVFNIMEWIFLKKRCFSSRNELKPHVEAIARTELGSPTMFEVSTALAILYFAKVSYPGFCRMGDRTWRPYGCDEYCFADCFGYYECRS